MRRMTMLAAVTAFACLLTASPASADYDDGDAGYLKVAYYFLYPVGKVAELFVFRPLHAVASASMPDPLEFETIDSTSRCIGFRPQRGCSRGR